MTAVLKGFVGTAHGPVHFRYGGRGPVVVLLHDSPRSSQVHVPDIEWLGEHFTVVALDTPGCGESAPLPGPDRDIPDFAAALAATLEALGIGRCAVYAPLGAAKIALRFAVDHPARAALTILDGLPLDSAVVPPSSAEWHLQAIPPDADGGHLPREWSRILDAHRWAPWWDRTAAARQAVPLPGDLELHEYATDLLMAGQHWPDASLAALRWPAAPDIARLRSPTVLLGREDDPSHAALERLPRPAVCRVERVAPQLPAWRTRLMELLHQADLPGTSWSVPSPSRGGPAVERQRYVNLVQGQIRVRLGPATSGVPLLLLHDAPGGSSSCQPLAALLRGTRPTIAPDMPGVGESHPLPYPSLGAYVEALLELLDELDCGPVDVHAEGIGTCFAIALAAHHPTRVRRLALDGLPLVRSRERASFTRHYCPTLVVDRHGTYLLHIWQRLREAEASWPWFDRSATAVRRRDVEFDTARMQASLVDVMKQLPSYGDAARAALQAAVREILRGVHQPVLLFDVPDDVRYTGTRRAARHLANARVTARPDSLEQRAGTLLEFLA